jgi:competence protein ComEA
MININKATREELISLKGIGPAIADRILERRRTEPFKDIYELSVVKGMGRRRIDKLIESNSVFA